jgi:predicted secreted hydrolase
MAVCSNPRNAHRGLLALLCALTAACHPAGTRDIPVSATLEVGELLGGGDTLHARAVAVPQLTFPADHGPHPDFRTEWWYFTGNLTAADGREFGYQLTFFRSALTDSVTWLARDGVPGPWRSRHAWMGHFAVSDVAGGTFHSGERFARDAAGLAGAVAAPFRVWLNDWHASNDTGQPPLGARRGGPFGATPGATPDAPTAATIGSEAFRARLVAAEGDVAIDLVVEPGKRMVLQGDRGLSQKGPEPGNASIYYSFTRMPTTGTVRIGDREYRVAGYSWLDREWSTSALSPDLAGWDWMSLQFDDSTELMLYRLRRADGSAGEYSAGTFVAADGSTVRLGAGDFRMSPRGTWTSPVSGATYPTAWRVEVPSLQLSLDVRAAFDAQEMNLAVRYWEGSVRISGTRGGAAVAGRGYLEMTGY